MKGLKLIDKVRKSSIAVVAAIAIITAILSDAAAREPSLPRGMVYLRQIDPSIAQDIRYAGSHNFLGRPVRGYGAAECILSAKTARALRRIQRRLRARRLSLKVYDCYRPMRAVRDFVSWARNRKDRKRKTEFYPGINKRHLFKRHYISKRSTHTRANTVDLTIIPAGSAIPSFDASAAQRACTLSKGKRSPDNSLDFGTGYDCFSKRSGRGLPRRNRTAYKNRNLLNGLMRDEGFKGYFREWWHFKLPHAGSRRAMDFPIRAMPNN